MPMTPVPPGTFRVRVPGDTARPPKWWEIRQYLPGQDHIPPRHRESVSLGHSERLPRDRWHRFYPATGEWPREVRGWTAGVRWLQEIRRGHRDQAVPPGDDVP